MTLLPSFPFVGWCTLAIEILPSVDLWSFPKLKLVSSFPWYNVVGITKKIFAVQCGRNDTIAIFLLLVGAPQCNLTNLFIFPIKMKENKKLQ